MVADTGVQHYTMDVRLSQLRADNHYTSLTLPIFQNDWYEGFFIPKGTICLANIWYGSKFALLCHKMPRET